MLGAWPSHGPQPSRLARRPPYRHCPHPCLHASCHVSLRRSAVPPRLSPAMLMLSHVVTSHCFASQADPILRSASSALDFALRTARCYALAAASRRVFAGGRGWSPKVKFEILRWSLFHDLSEVRLWMSLAVSATIFAGKAAIISAFFELYICILRSLQNIVIFQKMCTIFV